MQIPGALGVIHTPFAYFVINIDPIFLRLGSIAIHWYGLAYVVAICIGLWVILRYTRGLGLHEDSIWGVFIWTAIAGLVGGRLYYVIQQPDLLHNFILKPYNIIAVWNGGMAFFGAIFAGTAMLFFIAPRYGINRFIAIDCGALFAAVGQIFGRFGNIVNGDILGQALSATPINIPAETCAHAPCVAYVSDPHYLAWAEVYLNAQSFAPQGIPFQPAPVYEILLNLVILAILLPLRYRLPRIKAGLFFVLYLALYAVSQFIVFFARGSEPITPFLGVTALKQAQWTAVFVFLACIALAFLVWRFSRPWAYSETDPVPLPASLAERHRARMQALATRDTTAAKTPGSATEKAPTDAQFVAVEIPPWQPARPTGGALRNVFTPPSTGDISAGQ
ncbi:MAG TPA: prolipoprotein diacylglyceryl transferase [Ktedonobacterales bacterium]|nr:prolipoprotein diacylglyceryl transferase [Ktedonobacterales bacterium]